MVDATQEVMDSGRDVKKSEDAFRKAIIQVRILSWLEMKNIWNGLLDNSETYGVYLYMTLF